MKDPHTTNPRDCPDCGLTARGGVHRCEKRRITNFAVMKTKKLVFQVPVIIHYRRGRDLTLAIKQITEDLQCSEDLTNDEHRVMWKSSKIKKVKA